MYAVHVGETIPIFLQVTQNTSPPSPLAGYPLVATTIQTITMAEVEPSRLTRWGRWEARDSEGIRQPTI